MSVDVRLHHHDADQARRIVDELVSLYLAVYPDGGEFHSEDRYRRQLGGHMQAPGWELVTATAKGELVGYAYGFPLSAQTRWWSGIQQPVPAGFTQESGTRTFALSELLVRPSWQHRGIGRALHHELLGTRAEERSTLLADPDNFVAQAAYRSWGWRKITKLQPSWNGAPLYDVLTRPGGQLRSG
ncbi:Acetyltransferase (GNAT) family protein [Micromonospora matsumotoense]|uniref:Acetyltransferase (GNAT) family protein n=1 Tax=Micromonospora matsumotoense TaxID=121616 RepID=A0A1C4UD28_9ACTN|nr:GNAT family N-acetyltransferase [Micromonospora matsumotoense]SCE69561.1 Acetyltransferase (GNAT) family protein [Micromonospora matsumotoense]